MRKTIFTVSLLTAFLLVAQGAFALSFMEDSISVDVGEDSTKLVSLAINNSDNTTQSFTLSSENPDLVEPGLSSGEISANGKLTFNLLAHGTDTGEHSTYVNLNYGGDTETLPVTVKVGGGEGYLGTTFGLVSKNLETGITKTRTFTMTNRWDSRINILGLDFRGDVIITEEGSKPAGWSGELPGRLDPGESFSINIIYDTKNVDPGSYTATMIVPYRVNDQRKTKEVNFNINVIKSLVPGEKEQAKKVQLTYTPKEPKKGDFVTARLVDKQTTEPVSGTMKVYVLSDGQVQTQFEYTNPFSVEQGKKYCMNGTAKGYTETRKCFTVQKIATTVKVKPSSPTTEDTVQLQCVGGDGKLIDKAKLTLDDESLNTPQTTAKNLSTGKHTVECQAKGYETGSKSFTISKPLEIVSSSLPDGLGGNATMEFNQAVDWTVKRDGEQVGSSSGSKIKFSPAEPGNYTIYARGDKQKEFTVKQGAASGFIDILVENKYVIIVLVILFLAFVKPGWVREWLGGKGEEEEAKIMMPEEG